VGAESMSLKGPPKKMDEEIARRVEKWHMKHSP
jgi:hypothetical protein